MFKLMGKNLWTLTNLVGVIMLFTLATNTAILAQAKPANYGRPQAEESGATGLARSSEANRSFAATVKGMVPPAIDPANQISNIILVPQDQLSIQPGLTPPRMGIWSWFPRDL